MYYPAQAAEKLNIATSTLRKYASRFTNHLSPAAQRKHRRYTESDLTILRRICMLRDQSVPLAEISAHLSDEKLTAASHPHSVPDSLPSENGPAALLMDNLVHTMKQVNDLHDMVVQLRDETSDLGTRLTLALEVIDQLKTRPQTAALSAGSAHISASSFSDIKAELMQLKSEQFRTREHQKKLEAHLKKIKERDSGLFRRLR